MKPKTKNAAGTKDVFSTFLASYNNELQSKVKRLDELIGRKHWLSVGNYKESILRELISSVVPKRFEVSTGFVAACNSENEMVLSRQSDILVWDSANYSPIFRDKDFVVIPPESCRVMVEVKGMLTRAGLIKSVHNYDAILGFSKIQYLKYFSIKKLIFAYDTDVSVKSPEKIIQAVSAAYTKSKILSLQDRMQHISKVWPNDFSPWPLLSIDGIFVLGSNSTLRRIRQSNEGAKLMFTTYENQDPKEDHIYSQFEYEIQSSLADNQFNSQAFWYEYQPGLLSIKEKMKIKLTEPHNLCVFPPIKKENLHSDIAIESLYPCSLAKE